MQALICPANVGLVQTKRVCQPVRPERAIESPEQLYPDLTDRSTRGPGEYAFMHADTYILGPYSRIENTPLSAMMSGASIRHDSCS
jgi:hypothetical protein